MQTKTYFASSVPAALEVARREIGAEALLVGSRPSPAHARQFGRLEVTFAWDSKEEPLAASQKNLATRETEHAPQSQMDEIRRQLTALRLAVGGKIPLHEDNWIADRLVEKGFSPDTAAEIGAAASRNPGNSAAAVIHEITTRISAPAYSSIGPGESRTLALIGPPGRGKTTSLVKLAMTLGISRRIPVRIYSAGAHSIGAQDQMARFAAILGTPWQAYESLASLNLALNGDAWKGLALIDTPGISPADRQELRELEQFMGGRKDIEKHLVLRADATSADMLRMISRFAGLAPGRLLFTGIDEACSVAPLIETLMLGGVPAGFAGNGQQIPEDLEILHPAQLAELIWSGEGSFSLAAAPVRFAAAAA